MYSRSRVILTNSIIRKSKMLAEDSALQTPEIEALRRQIYRGLEEFKKMVEDFIFDTGNKLEEKSKAIKNISLLEDGSCIIKLVKEFKVSDIQSIPELSTKFSSYTIQNKFKTGISWSLDKTGELSNILVLNVKIIVPAEILSDMVGSEPTSEWRKAINSAEKLANSFLKSI